ncbi:carbohydrate ABC transporter permease [Saccharospirillum mangrovi]|uniref:carbohydrate ABC transporter permease n=1 Tax=Saccharospirillum mangrovi TaxID=2161747 RepID=UPI000D3BEEFB|nr:carbohydrate ABC transporter permease [Saccharospirillum mangrovi]
MTANFSKLPVLIILTLISLPLGVMYLSLVVDSFTNTPPDSLVPNEFTLEHWRYLIDPTLVGNIWVATVYTLIYAVSMAAIVIGLSATGGYALSRLQLPFRRFFLAGILVMHGFPAVTLIIGVFLVLKFIGLYDTLAGIVLVRAALTLPLGIWVMKGFYDAVPWELEMAGLQDGAGRFTVWWRIIVPQIQPGLMALGALAFIDAWGEFVIPRVLAPTTDFQVLSVFLNSISVPDSVEYNFNIYKAVGLFYTLPVLVLFIVFQNRLMAIFSGGTKG